MSLHPQAVTPVPEDTVRIAGAALPKGNRYMQMRAVLGVIYDLSFARLFSPRGLPAEAPWRQGLVTVMQFAEGLSDRQAAEAVRACINWKDVLGLGLDDTDFDFSVLSAFRTRLVAGAAESLLLDALRGPCREHGLLRSLGRQRTDATQVLGAVRLLNRIDQLAETLRATLNATATVAPQSIQPQVPVDWFERYGRRIEEYRLSKSKEARQAYGVHVGADGLHFLVILDRPDAPPRSGSCQQWSGCARPGSSRWWLSIARCACAPPLTCRVRPCNWSPRTIDPDLRDASKGAQHGVGYKVHATETCDDDLPHLLTQVETTFAPPTDLEALAVIQPDIDRVDLLPAEQIVDATHVRGRNLVTSQEVYQIDHVGPIYADRQWQAKAGEGLDVTHFRVDWEVQVVTCPRGRQGLRWCVTQTARERTMIHVDYNLADCTPCPGRPCCTWAKTLPRSAASLLTQALQDLRHPSRRSESPLCALEGVKQQAESLRGYRFPRASMVIRAVHDADEAAWAELGETDDAVCLIALGTRWQAFHARHLLVGQASAPRRSLVADARPSRS